MTRRGIGRRRRRAVLVGIEGRGRRGRGDRRRGHGDRRRRRGGALVSGAEVGADHLRVGAHLGRRPVGDQPAEVEHGHPVGDAHDQAHVVLDEEDGDLQPLADVADGGRHLAGLGGVHARHRLVEQQDRGLDAEGARHLDALLVAVGELAGGQSEDPVDAEELGDLADSVAVPAVLAHRVGQPQPGADEPRPGEVVAAEHQVLLHRRRGEERDVLEGAGHAEAGDRVRRQADEVAVAEAHRAGGGPVDAGQDVEHRRLAGAVGADQRVDRPGLNLEGDVVEGGDSREPDGDAVHREGGPRPHPAHGTQAPRRRREPPSAEVAAATARSPPRPR